MGIYTIKPRFQRSLAGVARWLVGRRVHPDTLTFAALVLSLAGGVALYFAPAVPWLLLAVPVVALARTALNALDGMVAKASGLARPWGEVLNEFCDRLADVALFGGLALSAAVELRLAFAALVLVLLSSYLGTVSKAAGGPRQYGGLMGKADRMLYLSLASVLAFFAGPWLMNYFLAFVLAGVLVTIAQRWRQTRADLDSERGART